MSYEYGGSIWKNGNMLLYVLAGMLTGSYADSLKNIQDFLSLSVRMTITILTLPTLQTIILSLILRTKKLNYLKLKWVKCKLHREFTGKIKSATVSQVPSGKYYVSILVDTEIMQLPINNNMLGFDLGLKEFLIDTNNNHIERPRVLYRYEEKLTKLQRQLCKKIKHSNNDKKQTKKIAKVHEKISNIRNDFSNKLSTQIINDNQVIISEDLQISNMIKNHCLAKSIADVGWSEFMRKLDYKSKWYGRTYYKINTWYASSQTCCKCSVINKKVKLLSIRKWVCESCGSVHNRDENAAKNILAQGLKNLGLELAS